MGTPSETQAKAVPTDMGIDKQLLVRLQTPLFETLQAQEYQRWRLPHLFVLPETKVERFLHLFQLMEMRLPTTEEILVVSQPVFFMFI